MAEEAKETPTASELWRSVNNAFWNLNTSRRFMFYLNRHYPESKALSFQIKGCLRDLSDLLDCLSLLYQMMDEKAKKNDVTEPSSGWQTYALEGRPPPPSSSSSSQRGRREEAERNTVREGYDPRERSGRGGRRRGRRRA